MMLNIVDPQKLGKLLKTKCIDLVDSEKPKELREAVSSMGEIAIKSLQRKEIATTLVYTGYIEDILSTVIEITPEIGKSKDTTVDAIRALLEQYPKNC